MRITYIFLYSHAYQRYIHNKLHIFRSGNIIWRRKAEIEIWGLIGELQYNLCTTYKWCRATCYISYIAEIADVVNNGMILNVTRCADNFET